MSLGVMENPDVNDKLPGKPEQTSDSDVCRGPSAVLGRPPLHARWYTTSLHSNQFQPSLFPLSKSAWSH